MFRNLNAITLFLNPITASSKTSLSRPMNEERTMRLFLIYHTQRPQYNAQLLDNNEKRKNVTRGHPNVQMKFK